VYVRHKTNLLYIHALVMSLYQKMALSMENDWQLICGCLKSGSRSAGEVILLFFVIN
jgi:hypothetical protein